MQKRVLKHALVIAAVLVLAYTSLLSQPVTPVTTTTYAERLANFQQKFDVAQFTANCEPPSVKVWLKSHHTDKDAIAVRRWLNSQGFYVEEVTKY